MARAVPAELVTKNVDALRHGPRLLLWIEELSNLVVVRAHPCTILVQLVRIRAHPEGIRRHHGRILPQLRAIRPHFAAVRRALAAIRRQVVSVRPTETSAVRHLVEIRLNNVSVLALCTPIRGHYESFLANFASLRLHIVDFRPHSVSIRRFILSVLRQLPPFRRDNFALSPTDLEEDRNKLALVVQRLSFRSILPDLLAALAQIRRHKHSVVSICGAAVRERVYKVGIRHDAVLTLSSEQAKLRRVVLSLRAAVRRSMPLRR